LKLAIHGQEGAACTPEVHFGMFACTPGKKVVNMLVKNESVALTNDA
jgi:hypothetical protein